MNGCRCVYIYGVHRLVYVFELIAYILGTRGIPNSYTIQVHYTLKYYDRNLMSRSGLLVCYKEWMVFLQAGGIYSE